MNEMFRFFRSSAHRDGVSGEHHGQRIDGRAHLLHLRRQSHPPDGRPMVTNRLNQSRARLNWPSPIDPLN